MASSAETIPLLCSRRGPVRIQCGCCRNFSFTQRLLPFTIIGITGIAAEHSLLRDDAW
jgi:hypothetical protein